MSTHTVAANVAYRGKPATLVRAAPMIPLLLSTTRYTALSVTDRRT
jgi:hypothetical protein